MQDIVTKRLSNWGAARIPPNIRMTVPDDIAKMLRERGLADIISPDIIAAEKAEPVKKRKAKEE